MYFSIFSQLLASLLVELYCISLIALKYLYRYILTIEKCSFAPHSSTYHWAIVQTCRHSTTRPRLNYLRLFVSELILSYHLKRQSYFVMRHHAMIAARLGLELSGRLLFAVLQFESDLPLVTVLSVALHSNL